MNEGESVRKSGPMVLLLAVLALLGIRAFTPEAPPPREGPNAKEEQRSSEERGDDTSVANDRPGRDARFWQPLLDFRNAGTIRPATVSMEGQPDVEGWDTRCLIVCVPDPVASSSGYRFDGLIDTIQRAAETQGYVYDRSYYPWPRRKEGGKNSNAVSANQKPDGSCERPQEQGSMSQPGLLLLRGNPRIPTPRDYASMVGLAAGPAGGWAPVAAVPALRRPHLLLVFLVGETATAGLDTDAFAASLQLIARSEAYQRRPTIQVLGPHFSGSQVSLERAIQAWAAHEEKRGPTFQVISGSATGIDKTRLEHCGGQASVSFQATVVPSRQVFAALVEYLDLGCQQGQDFRFNDRFAVLYESNTRFGQIQRGVIQPNGPGEPLRTGPTFFPFPLHISVVRGAYDKTTGATRDNTLRLPSFGSKLRLPLGDVRASRDVEPSLDAATTAVTSERLLAHMLETISRERFRYVFIVATDIRDKLFLAGLVRQQCPECRLVFSDSDLLFSHPDFSAALRGSIVGSSYPLCARNQRWSFPFRGAQARVFSAGPSEQGYYNATIALLNPDDSDALLEYGPPFPDVYPLRLANRPYTEALANAPVDRRRPPIWISIIGESDLYPLAVVPARIANGGDAKEETDSYGGYVFRAAEPKPGSDLLKAEWVPSHSGLWIVPVLGMVLLLMYVGWSYRSVVMRYKEWQQGRAQESGTELQKLLWPRSGRLRWRQQVYACVCLTSVLTVYSYLTFVWLLPLGHRLAEGENSPVRLSRWNWIMPVVLVTLLVAFFVLLLFRARWVRDPAAPAPASPQQPVRQEPSSRLPMQFLLRYRFYLLCAALLAIMATYLYRNGRYPRWWLPAESLLFAERATSLASGVSPVVPILLLGLAFFFWGHCQLKRLYLIDVFAVKTPFPSGRPTFEQVDRWHGEVTRDLRRPRRALAGKGAFVIWVILFFTFCRLSGHFVPAAEGIVTEVLLLLALTLLAMILVHDWLHLRKVWENTRRLLNALALLPLREAFERVPAAITRMFGPYLASQRPGRQEHLTYRLERRRLLVEEYQCIAGDLPVAVPLSATENAEVASALGMASKKAPLASDLLTDTARACLTVLHHVWRDPALAERLLEHSPGEEATSSPAASSASDHALIVHKKVQTTTQDGNSTLLIDEMIQQAAADAEQAVRRWLSRVRDFVALEVTVYLSQFFVQLRNLAVFLTFAPLLMLLAVTSYSFQPQRLWLLLSVALIGLVTLSVIAIVVQVERNELVSRILKTTPNQLNFHWDFFSRILLYAVPLLGIVVAMSGDLSDLIHSWVDPLLQAMK